MLPEKFGSVPRSAAELLPDLLPDLMPELMPEKVRSVPRSAADLLPENIFVLPVINWSSLGPHFDDTLHIWATIWATLRAEVGVSIWVPFTSTGPFSPFPVMLALCSGIVLSFRVIFLPCPASLVMFSLAPAIFSLFPASLSLFSC